MNASNVTAAKPNVAGGVYTAEKGTSLPTSATSTLGSGFANLGYLSDAGLTNSNSPTANDVKDWAGNIVLSTAGERPDTFKFFLLESLNKDVLETIYGSDNVTVAEDGSTKIAVNADEIEERAWVFDMVLRDGKLKRIVVPSGKITALGDIVYDASSAAGYDVTVSCYPDATGNTHYEYISA